MENEWLYIVMETVVVDCFVFSGDDVFMPNKAECEEYVLEEFGIIFAGNKNHINSFGWNFGQVNAVLKH